MKHKLFGTVTVGTKGQIVIPVEARNNLDIQTGDRLYVLGKDQGNALVLIKEEEVQKQIEHMTEAKDFLQNIVNNKK